ncbi:MAG: DUF1573 domain-containing protein [Bacteroidota bacterium]|nr:DUF1573 domain-containing protein [Bacteroidota bacterium]
MLKGIAILLFTAIVELSGPNIEFESEKYDFGSIKQGTIVTHTFSFKNSGDQPLIINKVSPSCGCLVSAFTKEPIAPGAEGSITVKFNSKDRPLGSNLKSFLVYSNSINQPHTIYIKGQILPKK